MLTLLGGIFGILPFELRNSLYLLVFDYFLYGSRLVHRPLAELPVTVEVHHGDSRRREGRVGHVPQRDKVIRPSPFGHQRILDIDYRMHVVRIMPEHRPVSRLKLIYLLQGLPRLRVPPLKP